MPRPKALPDGPEAVEALLEKPGLYRVMQAYGVTYRALENASGVSAAAWSILANHGRFPKKAMRGHRQLTDFKTCLERALRQLGVTPHDIQHTLWCDGERVHYEVLMRHHVPNTLTRAVLKHFRLGYDPFDSARLPQDADAILLTDAMTEVVEDICDRLNGGGLVALVGTTGMGKSWIREEVNQRLLAESTSNQVVMPRRVNRKRLTEMDLCEAIVLDVYGHDTRLRASGERRMRQAREAIASVAEQGGRIILVVDEAHLMHDRALVLLKNFQEISDGFHRGLSVLLVGQPLLENQLRGNPALREVWLRCAILHAPGLAVRKTARSRDWDDLAIEAYLAHKLRPFDNGAAGGALARVFDPGAVTQLRGLKDKCRNPMEVNRLVSVAMNLAFAADDERVTAEAITLATRSL